MRTLERLFLAALGPMEPQRRLCGVRLAAFALELDFLKHYRFVVDAVVVATIIVVVLGCGFACDG